MVAQETRLVSQAQAGNREAFENLYKAYHPRISSVVMRRVMNKDEAEDLIQMTFVRAFLGLKGFRGDSAFPTWLTRIALNVCTSHFRTMQARKLWLEVVEDTESVAEQAFIPYDSPEDVLYQKERQELVVQGIQALPEHCRKAVWLRYVEELSYNEIVEELQVPMGTVKTWWWRGRQQLKDEFQRSDLWAR